MTNPQTMTVITIAMPGGPDVLTPVDMPVPLPGPGEVLLEVYAASVNRPDVQQRRGLYPPPPGVTDIPGLDAAGRVAAVGDGVEGLDAVQQGPQPALAFGEQGLVRHVRPGVIERAQKGEAGAQG